MDGGSPPRAWGQSSAVARAPRFPRFTPTGVGTIHTHAPPRLTLAVHPHGRGDNCMATWWSATPSGSPPRAWGQCAATPTLGQSRRFTPTGVGTMIKLGLATKDGSVHPHGRGDNRGAERGRHNKGGSPPRAWGQCNRLGYRGGGNRFTPTGVGTIFWHCSSPSHTTVHPHGRGDNTMPKASRFEHYGSPPRAWGQCPKCTLGALDRRFTPTGVGTMPSWTPLQPSQTVHPHGRGDNLRIVARQKHLAGSPPRAWGQ